MNLKLRTLGIAIMGGLCISANAANTCNIKNSPLYSGFLAGKWYTTSAEHIAQYNEIYTMALEKIKGKVKHQNLEGSSWGVILDIDDTVLDHGDMFEDDLINCRKLTPSSMYSYFETHNSPATPGSVKFTCEIQKDGGKVVLVTNRNGNYDSKIQAATIKNLKDVGMCFDNVVFANSDKDWNKTPRFNAVIKGDYSTIVAANQLEAINVLAYFGDNIQDFPNITQAEAITHDRNSDYYSKFGHEYFSLPNPTYGSWEKNVFPNQK